MASLAAQMNVKFDVCLFELTSVEQVVDFYVIILMHQCWQPICLVLC